MSQMQASCDRCRERKVKCDRQNPCSNCVRHRIPCHVSTAKPRPRGRTGGRKRNDAELQSRIAKLEALVEAVSANAADNKSTSSTTQPTQTTSPPDSGRSPSGGPEDKLQRYVAGPLWSQLSAQIEGLREILLEESDEDNHEATSNSISSPASQDSSTLYNDILLFGPGDITVAYPKLLEHPHPALRQRLLSVYALNVDPCIKVYHLPTLRNLVDTIQNNAYPDQTEAANHAILFAMYGAAAMSLNPTASQPILEEPREPFMRRMRAATEYYLTKSNYLETRTLALLQAFVVYLTLLRSMSPGQKH